MGAGLFVVALVAAGCGGGDDEATPSAEAAAPDVSEFPAADGRTLEQIAADEGDLSELVVAPSGQVFHKGENRLGFGVFTIDQEAVSDATVALYAARPDGPAIGPFPASAESLAVDAAFQSKSTASDPAAAENVYAAEIELDGRGEWRLLALIKEGDGYSFATLPSAVVGAFPDVPQIDDPAPEVETLTADDVGGAVAEIDTRQPPSTMHEDNFADVVGEEPTVLLFATPALCTSRVCGPVVDIAEQVKSERGDEAAFIMQEIYEDNEFDPENLREPVRAFNLPSEPWLFVIDADGNISTAIEGAFSEVELNAALDKVTAS